MTDAIAWALVHFVWQGAALALVALLLMHFASSSSVRYTIGVATMAAMVAAVGFTIATGRTTDLVQGSTGSIVQGPTEVQSSSAPINQGVNTSDADGTSALGVLGSSGPSRRSLGEGGLPTTWILTIWIVGIVVLSTRAVGGWWLARRVARDAVTPISDELQSVARSLATRLGIRRVVGVFESSRISVPVMIGWLRPVVLMPPAALSGLSIAQVEAIFAHEFAHIRRHDYVVNLLQTGVETALFFHPAVWWLSREIRRERELCCDDVAVQLCDRVTYATALSALAHLQPPSLALAATDGSLRDRVRRIISNSPSSDSAKGGWMAMLPLLLVLSLAAPSAFTQSTAVPPKSTSAPAVVPKTPLPKDVAEVVAPTPSRRTTLQPPKMSLSADSIEIVPESLQNQEINQLLDEQLALDRQRLQLEKERLQNDSAFELRQLELRVQNVSVQLEAFRKTLKTGGESGVTLRDWEDAQKLGVAELATARRALDLKLMELNLRDQELVLKRRMQKAGMTAPKIRPVEVTPVLKLVGPAEAIRSGDTVTVRIDGAPALPSEHSSTSDGSILFPFLGAVSTEGQTTSQLAATLGKLLTARSLATNPRITVSAVRRQGA